MTTATVLVMLVLGAMTLGPAARAASRTTSGNIPLMAIQPSTTTSTFSENASTVDISMGLSAGPSIAGPPAGTPTEPSVGPAPVMVSPTESTIPAGSVTINSNSLSGFTVQVATANGTALSSSMGILKSADSGNNSVIAYTVNFGGVPLNFAGGSAMGMNTNKPTPAGGLKIPVTVTLHLSPLLQAGTYGDVLKFTTQGK